MVWWCIPDGADRDGLCPSGSAALEGQVCDTRARSVAFGVLNWMVWVFPGGSWGCTDSLAGSWEGFIFLGFLVGFMLGKVSQGKSCAAAGSPFSFLPSCGLWHPTCLSHAGGTLCSCFLKNIVLIFFSFFCLFLGFLHKSFLNEQ